MKSSKNALHSYLSQFGSIKILVWVVALGVIAAYGLLDTEASQQMGNPYLQQVQQSPSIQQEQYPQALQQPLPQSRQYHQGSGQFPSNNQQQINQIQQDGGYPNGSGSNYPSNTANTYPNSQGGDYLQKEPLDYGY